MKKRKSADVSRIKGFLTGMESVPIEILVKIKAKSLLCNDRSDDYHKGE